ncbi:MAG: class I SAM-dependent RNA methyltransferase [Acidobacteria bacterium]|nr:class I SAM-dependent RNA methyltransferase [Acidobacteriota bacterium]
MPMTAEAGSEITLDIEKPAVGGRMLARHDGQVALVWGAIPGERVRAQIERVSKSVIYATTTAVLTASPDRREAGPDWRCGGNVFAHIGYDRQRGLKAEIIRDALRRIGRVTLPAAPDVVGSPERGYRMRARLHARDGRLGFFREGTHRLCDAAATGQLRPQTTEWIAAVERVLARDRLAGLDAMEIAENVAGDERACHLELQSGVEASRFGALAAAGALTGLSATRADRPGVEILAGTPSVSDVLHVRPGDPARALRLRRDVRAFFQGNRFLLEPLVHRVVALVPPGPVVDLYAGVGLFGLALAAAGAEQVTLVEGDPVSGMSLDENAEPLRSRVRVEHRSVESYVGRVPTREPSGRGGPGAAADPASTFIVDPPRTGLSKAALAGIVAAQPARVVYVSCDVATLARDTRLLLDAGYVLDSVTGIDLFPNTAHVEAVTALSRPGPPPGR